MDLTGVHLADFYTRENIAQANDETKLRTLREAMGPVAVSVDTSTETPKELLRAYELVYTTLFLSPSPAGIEDLFPHVTK